LRKAAVAYYWAAAGSLKIIAGFQWFEAVLVSFFSSMGAYFYGAFGTAVGLCISELLLSITAIALINKGTR
jgi:hypothetical protein